MSNIHESAARLRKCILAGVKNLENNQDFINELNVFPVPDGDTGTNMTMTMQTAAKEVLMLSPDAGLSDITKALSSGSLRGARGNSGVILSQLIRGFCKTVSEKDGIDSATLAASFKRASDTAYKAVMKPKEGTILTVAKGMSEKIVELSTNEKNIEKLLSETIKYGHEVLKRTPEMLPVLKEAGVVDSGGQGLMCFLDGALSAITSMNPELFVADGDSLAVSNSASQVITERKTISTDDIKFGYCTECIINLNRPLKEEELSSLKEYLLSLGDSLVCVDDDELVKIHVHTNHPGLVFEKGLEFGSLSRLKVDNLHEEHEEKLIKDASKYAMAAANADTPDTSAECSAADTEHRPVLNANESAVNEYLDSFNDNKPERKEMAVIAVCAGDGLAEIFKGLGVDYCITGGQTMNPSTEDILTGIENVNADSVIVLPDNKNIILAAEQAKAICEESRVYVIPSKTVPQGITAMVNFDSQANVEDNVAAMSEAIDTVKTGEVTHSVRNTMISGREINEGDIMGIGDRGILAVGQVLNDTAFDMVKEMVDEDSSFVTIYRGEDIREEDAVLLQERVKGEFPQLDVELEYGGQPVYYYIISAE